MIKHTLFILFVLFLFGCGKKNASSSSGDTEAAASEIAAAVAVTPPIKEEVGMDDKIISKNNEKHAPMNFLSQELTMKFDPVAQTVTGHSVINFNLIQSARPYFELKGTLKNIKIDQAPTTVTAITDPDGQSQSFWSIKQIVSSDDTHQLEFDYELPTGRVTFINGGVRFLTDMTDINGKFFEYWGPVGFEGDAFSLNLQLKVVNSTSTHKLFTNGNLTSSESQVWQISFPEYYSKSSFYVHLTNLTTLPSQSFVYKGLEKDIPVQVYGVTSALVSTAVAQLPGLFKELEAAYGAYPHAKFLAYMNDRSGGMEYVGATITSVGSLDHELLHSWFGRSLIPADGKTGWLDEAMASWRDYGYTRASTVLNRAATNLANFSPFRKSTPSNSYVDGRGLMAELDREFASIGGLKPVMKAFYLKYKNSIVTNDLLWNFLEDHTKLNLDAFRLRYTMGGAAELAEAEEAEDVAVEKDDHSKHPEPLTEEEVLRLR